MQYCASLGRIDLAFELADACYLRRGRWSVKTINPITDPSTSVLFNPLTAPMRSDPRFPALVGAIGLADYWQQIGSRPDYQRV
jgi:hypothetical protein